mgnify:CR=1 FL=1
MCDILAVLMNKKKLFLYLFFAMSMAKCCAYLPFYWERFVDDVSIGVEKCNAWVDVSRSAMMSRFGYQEQNIERVCLYAPYGTLEKKPISFFLVHGTWAHRHIDFYSEKSPYFCGVKSLVKELAQRLKAPIELVSYSWSGSDSFPERLKAGTNLSQLINTYYGPLHGYQAAYAYGHSHGCNVINIALQDAVFDFESLYYVASPIIEHLEPVYSPNHFKALYNLYSDDDLIQSAGSVDRRSTDRLFKSVSGSRLYREQLGRDVYNIRVRLDGKIPGHVKIKKVASALLGLVDVITEKYMYHTSLVANLFLKEKGRTPLVAIKEKISQEAVLRQLIAQRSRVVIARKLYEELTFSKTQEAAYSQRYRGRSIHYQTHWFKRIRKNLQEISEVFSEWLGFDEGEKPRNLFLPL